MKYRITAIGYSDKYKELTFPDFHQAVHYYRSNYERLDKLFNGTSFFIVNIDDDNDRLHYPAVYRDGININAR